MRLAAAPQKGINIMFTYRHSNWSRRLLSAPRQCICFSRVGFLYATFQKNLCVSKTNMSSQKHLTGAVVLCFVVTFLKLWHKICRRLCVSMPQSIKRDKCDTQTLSIGTIH